jgi:hypothetical protein
MDASDSSSPGKEVFLIKPTPAETFYPGKRRLPARQWQKTPLLGEQKPSALRLTL